MSTATSALRTDEPEPMLRRRRTARAPRPFAVVRSAMPRRAGAERHAAEASSTESISLPAPPRPAPTHAPAEIVRSIVRSGVLSAPANALPVVEPGDIVRAPRRIELTDAELDLAFATVPRATPAHRTRDLVRPPADRGPRHHAPRSELSLYARGPVRAGRARGVHPLRRVEQAKVGLAALAVTALMTALIVVAFLGLAHVRAGGFVDRVDSTTPGISGQAGFGTQLTPGR
ncbi:hypothetical protein [Nocardia alba]|uniref:Uncharacterized protein n=1 Tax=Nocardia alba TaxID=225051 RepID=A0A4R1F9R1_9NOCA|nr:hypothetical protein [Nocardia alba]TCJ89542.1 hypothetical protein DFR71_6451 [Nocardia alba]